MTPEYSQLYGSEMELFEAGGNNIDKDPDIQAYAIRRFDPQEEQERFQTRAKIHRKLGANQHWTGDGTTKCLLPGSNTRGVVETYTYDKNPKTLAQYGDALIILPTKPIG